MDEECKKKKQVNFCGKNDFTAIDIETTGLSYSRCKIIELAAVRYRDGVAVETFQQLVNPNEQLDPFIIRLTGISDEMLENAPDISEALPRFFDFLGNDIVLGHNVGFDAGFISEKSRELGLPPINNDYINTLSLARKVLIGYGVYGLSDVAEYLGVNNLNSHRGVGDAVTAAECYLKMLSMEEYSVAANQPKTKKSIKDIVPNVEEIDENNPLFSKNIVFTGAMSMPRTKAAQIAVNCGAFVKTSVSISTDYLVVGLQDETRVGEDGLSSKEERAYKLNNDGKANIAFLTEAQFLELAETGELVED